RFTAPGGAGDEYEAAVHFGYADEGRRQVQFGEFEDLPLDVPHDDAHGAALAENVHAEAAESGYTIGQVGVAALFEGGELLLVHDLGRKAPGVVGSERVRFDEADLAV